MDVGGTYELTCFMAYPFRIEFKVEIFHVQAALVSSRNLILITHHKPDDCNTSLCIEAIIAPVPH